jgi:hypothetical protein
MKIGELFDFSKIEVEQEIKYVPYNVILNQKYGTNLPHYFNDDLEHNADLAFTLRNYIPPSQNNLIDKILKNEKNIFES